MKFIVDSLFQEQVENLFHCDNCEIFLENLEAFQIYKATNSKATMSSKTVFMNI